MKQQIESGSHQAPTHKSFALAWRQQMQLSFYGGLSAANTSILYQLASSCPDINGTAVFRALALYHSVNSDDRITLNTCDRNIETEDRGERRRNVKNNSAIELSNRIELFPNPSQGNFTVIVPFDLKDCEIKISNIMGQVISLKQYAIESEGIINVNNNLAKGVYIVAIKNNLTNENCTKKLIIE